MSETRRVVGITVLKWLGGVSGAALVFVLANRRIVTVAYRFARWELRDQWPFFASILGAALVLPLTYLLLRLLRIPMLSPRLLFSRYWRWSAAATTLVAATIVLLLSPYVRKRYQYFSEVSFQIEALEALERNQFQQARSTCTEYLSLYPQRQVDSAWPDPVCAPILTFTDDMGYIAAYLKNRPAPQTQTRDGVWLPVDFSVRGGGFAMSRDLGGGRISSVEPPRGRRKKSPVRDTDDEPAE